MKKPEKKVFEKGKGFISLMDREFGYNQAFDDWEKYHKWVLERMMKDKSPTKEERDEKN